MLGVMSPWLFNVYMDGVVREVNERVQGKGLVMIGEDGGKVEDKSLVVCR